MLTLKNLLTLSRPRLWMYLILPYLIGLLAGLPAKTDIPFFYVLWWALFFTFPANLFLYGLADVYEQEEQLNLKKNNTEPKKKTLDLTVIDEPDKLLRIIELCVWPFIIVGLLHKSMPSFAAIGAFFFFAYFYSAPKIKARTKPFLGLLFNILYVAPGILAYVLLGNTPRVAPIIAGLLWYMAAMTYKSVAELQSGEKVGKKNIATAAGPYSALLLCTLLYAVSAALAFPYIGWLAIICAITYIGLTFYTIYYPKKIDSIYKWYPAIHVACGASIILLLSLLVALGNSLGGM